MAVGYLWYGPLFGKTWTGMMGFTPESVKAMKMTPKQAMAGGFITALIFAYALAMFANLIEVSGLTGAFTLGFWIWFGFVATIQAGSFLWEGRPFKLFAFNAVESLIATLAMALVVVLWQ
ncbi:MAG: hypothetical protein G01um101430_516 [Parcubacteria group bacterium Gr01-1014_30]|nr:MAG: hypothetical protein G01um101430_516 [Parcubacteria group bacterium Gr01-1014_30]